MTVSLRPALPDDLPHVLTWLGDSETSFVQWGGSAFGWPIDQDRLAKHFAEAELPHKRVYTAIEKQQPVGHVELVGISTWQERASIGRVLINPDQRGRGLARSMVAQVMVIAFNELKVHRLDLSVAEFNAPAIRVYERLGFVREGLTREGRRAGDRRWSSIQMSVLAPEYRGVTSDD